MKKILIIQTSLNPNGNTQKLAKFALNQLKLDNIYKVEYLNLMNSEIELCTGDKLEEYTKETQELYKYIESFDGYILASPIYNYAISGVCKNFLDIHTKAMENKYLGFIQTAGSMHHAKSPHNALKDNLSYFKVNLLEVSPRATYKSFKGDELIDETFKSEFEKMSIELGKVIVDHKSYGAD
jgi:NAD(P)H-dependent FMN reductase